mmetsp:Transcript_8326/g.17364  ORF Transcript_8326/g.17364 Transcript_8326/m.17364 type:complete len:345 (-) Transcript_8326:267-1301(-)
MLEDAVLVDARLVGERVGADDRLVRLDGDARVHGHHLGGAHDLACVDVAVDWEVHRPGAQRHHHLLERSVAGPLAERVERHFDLASPHLHRRQRVGGREAEVVVAVRRPDDALAIGGGVLDAILKDGAILRGKGVPDRVGQVDRRGASLDHRRAQLDQEVGVRTACVLGGELDVVDERAGELDLIVRDLEALGARDAQLVLEVDVGRGEEGVDPVERRVLHRVVARLDVLLVGASEPGDAHRQAARPPFREVARCLGHLRDRLEVSLRGDGEACLAHVDAEARELLRDVHLLVLRERRTGGLLAVPQRRVKDDELLELRCGGLGGVGAGARPYARAKDGACEHG